MLSKLFLTAEHPSTSWFMSRQGEAGSPMASLSGMPDILKVCKKNFRWEYMFSNRSYQLTVHVMSIIPK